MQEVLKKAVTIVGQNAAIDSPVYTFLNRLQPPVLAKEEIKRAAKALGKQTSTESEADQPTVRASWIRWKLPSERSDFATAKSLLTVVRSMLPNDPYIVQKLALATYKSRIPTTVDALKEAEQLLLSLQPETSTDTETLGLYGSVQKRLWDEVRDIAQLNRAIWASEKGFYVKNDYYNGINLAYMLNVRAGLPDAAPADAIADFVLAQRTRRRVLQLCEQQLASQPLPTGESEFWIKATMSQAYAGLGDDAKANELLDEAKKLDLATPTPSSVGSPAPPPASVPVPQWMIDSTVEQLEKLRLLLKKSPLDRIVPQ